MEGEEGTDSNSGTTGSLSPTSSASSTSSTDTASSTADPPGPSTSTTITPQPSTTFGEESGESASSTGEPLSGLGCGPPPVCDRGTYDGDLFVSSPDEIAGYTAITGSLSVFRTDFVCLDFLSCMQTVGDVFQVFDNRDLRDLSGTNAILDVGAADPTGERSVVYISNNDGVTRLDGLDSVSAVGKLVIQNNHGLERIAGLASLVDVRNEMFLLENPVLIDLGTIAALDGPTDECWIKRSSVCQSVAVAVCGDIETVGDNDDGC